MKKIGYTTGVFDLFHIGHLNILKRARLECDHLIVGVTTDELCESAKNQKPFIPFQERMDLVEAVKYVDEVVPQTSYDKIEAWNNLKFDKNDEFVIYQGSHGDRGAEIADVILPSAAYTEENGLYQNLEGRVQECRKASYPAGEAIENWKVFNKLAKAYKKRKLAPENLSRTLEDSGTVTSVLIPWNTCGAYQSGVLGVSVADYFIYSIFNWISPFITLFYAAFKIKIKMISSRLNNSK